MKRYGVSAVSLEIEGHTS